MLIRSSELLRQCPGVSYRQLDYWCRTGIIEPVVEARGSGCHRRFSPEQVRVVALVAQLSALGAEGPALQRAAREASMLSEQWWEGPVIVSAQGDLSGEAGLKHGGYIVDLTACASNASNMELLSA